MQNNKHSVWGDKPYIEIKNRSLFVDLIEHTGRHNKLYNT